MQSQKGPWFVLTESRYCLIFSSHSIAVAAASRTAPPVEKNSIGLTFNYCSEDRKHNYGVAAARVLFEWILPSVELV